MLFSEEAGCSMMMMILRMEDDGGPWKGEKAGDCPDEESAFSEATI